MLSRGFDLRCAGWKIKYKNINRKKCEAWESNSRTLDSEWQSKKNGKKEMGGMGIEPTTSLADSRVKI